MDFWSYQAIKNKHQMNGCRYFKHTHTSTHWGNPLIFTKCVWDKNAPSVYRPLHKGQSYMGCLPFLQNSQDDPDLQSFHMIIHIIVFLLKSIYEGGEILHLMTLIWVVMYHLKWLAGNMYLFIILCRREPWWGNTLWEKNVLSCFIH